MTVIGRSFMQEPIPGAFCIDVQNPASDSFSCICQVPHILTVCQSRVIKAEQGCIKLAQEAT